MEYFTSQNRSKFFFLIKIQGNKILKNLQILFFLIHIRLHIITWKQHVSSDSHVQETAMLHPTPHLNRHPRYFWENVLGVFFLIIYLWTGKTLVCTTISVYGLMIRGFSIYRWKCPCLFAYTAGESDPITSGHWRRMWRGMLVPGRNTHVEPSSVIKIRCKQSQNGDKGCGGNG